MSTSTSTSTASLDVTVSLATCSIGLPSHTLPQKLDAISRAGFHGIELAFPDLLAFANQTLGRTVKDDDYEALCQAGVDVRKLCEATGLKILVLQPFSNFEGWPRDSPERKEAFERARGWISIMEAVGTDMLQVGSSDSPGIAETSIDDVVADLRELADMLAKKHFKLAYENWCWGTKASTWKDVWMIVQRVDRPNIGLCLDTFQSAGGEWGDPTTASGRIEADGVREADLSERYLTSLRELSSTVPAEKIYFLQISDAYRASPPLSKDVDEESGLRPRGRWSHDQRPLPYDGGYLPIVPFAEAVLKTGFRGWFSVEVFDGQFERKYGDNLALFAKDAMEAHRKLLSEAAQHGDTTE